MKRLARSFVWWPKMDQDIEERVRDCESCQYNRHHPPKAPLHPWEWPKCSWVRLHADYAGSAPAELLLERIPRSHLDLLKPSLEARVHGKQTEQKNHHDQHAKERKFSVEDLVFVCEFPSKKKWLSGKVTMVKGPVTYLIELTEGRIVC